MDIDLTEAAYHWLKADTEFQNLVLGGYIGTEAADDATDPQKIAGAWLFRVLDEEGRPPRDPEGSGKSVVVVSSRSEWSAQNAHNTAGFPRVQVLIYTDVHRETDGSPKIDSTTDNPPASTILKHVAKRINLRFHLPNKSDTMWWHDPALPANGVWVHSSLRSSPLDIRDVPLTQGYTVRGEMEYEVISD